LVFGFFLFIKFLWRIIRFNATRVLVNGNMMATDASRCLATYRSANGYKVF